MKGKSRTTAMMIDSLSLHPSHSLDGYAQLNKLIMLTKKYSFIFFLTFQFTNICFGQHIIKLDETKFSAANLDIKIAKLMNAANVQGLAITIFNNNKPVYKKTFGYKNALTKEPIKNETNFYGASLSKPVINQQENYMKKIKTMMRELQVL